MDINISYNKKRIITGLFLLLLGLIVPFFINERSFNIYDSLGETLATDAPLQLFYGATKLVLMNCIRALPHYMGAFVISESISFIIKKKPRFSFNIILTFGIIWIIYYVIDLIYPIKYDFGIPAILIVLSILILSYLNLFSVSWINKFIIVLSLLLSVQWLDIVPSLTSRGFGRGEISWDIKMVALLLDYGGILTLYALSMFVAFMICSLIQVQILYKEHSLQITTLKNTQVGKELMDAQMNALRMRSFGEVQSLVHDLKTPLTTILGLVSLSEMLESDTRIKEYLGKISDSVTSMNVLISAILYEDKMNNFTTSELMRSVLSQISISIPKEKLINCNDCPGAVLYGNNIRLSRAIVNLINNAFQAIEKDGGVIKTSIYRDKGEVVIEVYDSGEGIAENAMQSIWELGFSGNSSTGLGLNFTKQVIENHGGKIIIESEIYEYTKVIIRLEEIFLP